MKTKRAIPIVLVAIALAAGSSSSSDKPKVKALTAYQGVVVEKFTVEKNSATEDFPRGQEQSIQQNTVQRLMKEKLFEEVVDAGADTPPSGGIELPSNVVTGSPEKRRLKLNGTVVFFDKGSRAARWWVGFGAGATKVKVRFVLTDVETGAEVFRTERKGSFSGVFSFVGGGKDQATGEAAGDVVDGLVKDIKKNR